MCGTVLHCAALCVALRSTVCGYRRAADQRHVHLPDYSALSCLLLPSSAESCVRQGSTLPPSPPLPPRCRLMLARDTGATPHCSSRAEYTVHVERIYSASGRMNSACGQMCSVCGQRHWQRYLHKRAAHQGCTVQCTLPPSCLMLGRDTGAGLQCSSRGLNAGRVSKQCSEGRSLPWRCCRALQYCSTCGQRSLQRYLYNRAVQHNNFRVDV